MSYKIVVKRVGSCAECGAVIPLGSQAWWDPNFRILTCLSHFRVDPSPQPKSEEGQDFGAAGGSAQAMQRKFQDQDQKRTNREREIFTVNHPFLSRYITTKSTTSHQAKVWAKGAEGEIEVGRALDNLGKKYGFLVIHDRLMPKSRANIDHMAVTSTGIFIIDAKYYQGRIEVRGILEKFVGGQSQLWIGNRNRTSLLDGMNKQVLAVEKVLEHADVKFPVLGALAFYNARWVLPTFLRPNSVNGILVNSKGLDHIFRKLAPNDPQEVARIAELLLVNLRPAS